MSKSYGNIIPLFLPEKALRSAIMKVKSDSTGRWRTPRNPKARWSSSCTSWSRAHEQQAQLAAKLRAGNYGWGHAKQELFEELNAQLSPMRERYSRAAHQSCRAG